MSKKVTADADYKGLLDLVAIYVEADNRLQLMQTKADQKLIDMADADRSDYAKFQVALNQAETAAHALAIRHPEWFDEKRSVETIYGAVKFHKSTALESEDEELSIALIAGKPATDPAFDAAHYLRDVKELNLDTLKDLSDEELAQFKITRVESDNFSIKPRKTNLGKLNKEAVKRAAKQEVAA